MAKIGIIICARYASCGGGKCFRALRRRQGAFSRYPTDEAVEVVGYSTCGGCPGGNVEYVPEEMKSNGAEVIHLATGLVVGYPPCPHIEDLRALIETKYQLQVVVGTHPIPLKYLETHECLSCWERVGMPDIAGELLSEDRRTMAAYD